ncbi:DUF2461 domain-containing protein [Cyclobacterium amurskyense]|uniref:DUF2461 domain-containing protein n=1 Tax=Cyclobacterium amurskyense TaxID=320787 RepID=UPI0030D95BAA|tara:strand:- start:810 stop:1493 length:684 start_codon:yes stop_codon:yes gene_type:complete
MPKKDILDFLKELASNNSKEWMDENRNWYLQEKAAFLEKVAEILAQLSIDEPGFSDLRPKDCVFRQNRDIRFSANKAPYKSNMAAYFSVGGKKSEGPGYYLHVQPGGSFVGGGIWMPQAPILKKIRQEIDYSGKELRNLLMSPEIKNTFGEMQGEKLKTSPKGFEKDHPFIEFLRYKSFILSHPIPDEEIHSGAYVATTLEAFSKMRPFQAFLNQAVSISDEDDILL